MTTIVARASAPGAPAEVVVRVMRAIDQQLGFFVDNDTAHRAARAAILAMREPTDAMAEAGWEHTADPCWKEDVKRAWRAMIDTALSSNSHDGA